MADVISTTTHSELKCRTVERGPRPSVTKASTINPNVWGRKEIQFGSSLLLYPRILLLLPTATILSLIERDIASGFASGIREFKGMTIIGRHIPITKVKTKPRTNQPRRVQFVTTEVRCQEKTRGGLRYEVILGESDAKATPPPKKQLSPKNSVSVQDIEDKLKAAEERRLQIESNKIAALTAKMGKIEEASRKRDEHTTQFISQTKDALEKKLEDHIENVEKARLTLEQQTGEVRTAIEDKLKTASVQRDENMKKMLERLKEHEEQVQKVRTSNAVKFQQLDASIQEKLESAKSRKEQLELEQREKLRSHHEKVEEVKQAVEIRKTETVTKIETKLSAAEQKREKEMQRKLETIKRNEKRAEVVRQNKANIIANKLTPTSD
ncbi:unnamed protein product [Brassicogethes aeneus]|uniref:Uncharacterized protein n=1 Tax=Brassicogethes aeneus TaxID=1431903 RepID=A0A9P0FJB5_BRAAE|nr:unnamed protein product [Brassicogethes aeneus]